MATQFVVEVLHREGFVTDSEVPVIQEMQQQRFMDVHDVIVSDEGVIGIDNKFAIFLAVQDAGLSFQHIPNER